MTDDSNIIELVVLLKKRITSLITTAKSDGRSNEYQAYCDAMKIVYGEDAKRHTLKNDIIDTIRDYIRYDDRYDNASCLEYLSLLSTIFEKSQQKEEV